MFNKIIQTEIEKKKEKTVSNRVNMITSHMFKQYKEHLEASSNTSYIFNKLLDAMEDVTEELKESFESKKLPIYQVYSKIDSDRSVGILNILWHSLSFTTRGNNKPLALNRKGQDPLFSGRIVALYGDFQDVSIELQDQEYSAILDCEIASMFVPADRFEPAVIRLRHVEKDVLINQIDAPREFLLKVIEIICGGGIYHESQNCFYEEE